MNRIWRGFQGSIIFVLAFAAAVNAFDVRQALRNGLGDLKATRGDPRLCVLTDATYVRVDGKTTEVYVDVIQEETGCTVGGGNLLFFHRPMDYPVKIAIFRRETEECVVISYDGTQKRRKKYDLGFKAVSKPEFWIELSPPLGPDTFTVVSLSHAWAAGVPYDLLKSAEFHGHFCPAIAAGHVMAQYIISNYPLKEGESYTWIASPPWCKDDALQLLLHLTPGKKRLYAQGMTASQKEALTFDNPAGTLLISGEDKTKTRAVVFSFDWNKVRQEDKLKMALSMIPYLEKPEELVKVVKETRVTPEVVQRLTTAETNPYKWLGLTR
ncbi:MAG: FmdE family protein [Thermodesulfobacteriota bacterium]|nr:FmdE family protein [Thermodesulfobacteriota bacterium]